MTSDRDDGGCDTLRQALAVAERRASKTVSIDLPAGTVITLLESGLIIPPGVSINGGKCTQAGPPIIIFGNNLSGDGLTLKGDNTISGLRVGGFTGNQIKVFDDEDDDSNRLNCVAANRDLGNILWWQPTPDKPIHWHIQLSEAFVFPRDVIPGVTVYDLDGELTSAETVARLHSLSPDIKVICYFDAGVYESYRSDADQFPKSVIGKTNTAWPDSYWLDIRQTDILLPIMQNRIQSWCKDKGFDGIDPDETEVWSNDSGFPITKEQNNYYNKSLTELAHPLGLGVGLKGNATETGDLWPYFDWSLNESCWRFNECELLKRSFIDHGKAVFNLEYQVQPDCVKSRSWHLNSVFRDLNLVGPTNPSYVSIPCVPNSQNNW